MVNSFIDIESGVTFNGSQPYEFWFEDGQSVNLFYVKRIVFLSDLEHETVTVEEDGPFFLIDMSALQAAEQAILSDDEYWDLATVGSLSVQTTGVSYKGHSIHTAYVCCKSDEAGQFKSTFTIGDEEFTIGADFYNEDERLTGNLENLGLEIPGTVQKAIYETNVHEEAADNITMNRKWKELLLEYWRIAACKGSYRSLISSLKWFEYGELVKILEYWKREDVGRPVLISNDIEQIMSDLFRDQLSVLAKTTYIGLYLALEKPSSTSREDDEHPFFNDKDGTWPPSKPKMLNENNPILNSIASVWSAHDLMLKMTLVGNFFATYFMPIHLDLIHSTVENIVFTNAMKVMAGGMQAREDWIHCGGTFKCTSFTDGADFYMQPIDCEVGPLTILGLKDAVYDFSSDPAITNESQTLGAPENCPAVLGYNLNLGDLVAPIENGNGPLDIKDLLFSATNRYSAYGAPVHFDIEILENVPQDDFIKAAQIHWRRNYTELFDYRDAGIYIEPATDSGGKSSYSFSFNILLENEGRYDLSVIFESSKGIWYSKKFTVNVLDDTDNHISIYKITRGDIDQWKDTSLVFKNEKLCLVSDSNTEIVSDVNEFMMSGVAEFPEMTYAQFIHSEKMNFSRTVGLNHVIMIPSPVPNNGKVLLVYSDGTASLDVNSATEDLLNETFPNYWWVVRETETWMKNVNEREDFDAQYKGDLESEKSTVIIGIRKYFTTEREDRILAKKRYNIGSSIYEATVTQEGNMASVNVRCLTGPGESVCKKKLSREIEIDLLGKHKTMIHIHPDCTSYPSNKNSEWGSPEKRIKVKGYSSRIVDEDRFVPLFHKLEPITTENWDLGPGESCLAVPHFRRSQQDKTDELTLYFTHCGTAVSSDTKYGDAALLDSEGYPTKVGITAISKTNPTSLLAAEYKRRPLKRGYYDVTARYKYNGEWHTEKQAGAFRIC